MLDRKDEMKVQEEVCRDFGKNNLVKTFALHSVHRDYFGK